MPIHRQLPPVCALCGHPATEERRIAFYGIPGELARLTQWSWTTDHESPVVLPLCQEHRSFRRWWPFVGQMVGLVPLLVLVVFGVFVSAVRQHVGTIAVLALVLICLDGLLFFWLFKRALRIRAARITSKDVVLVGVAPEFARACEEMHRRQAEQIQIALDDVSVQERRDGG